MYEKNDNHHKNMNLPNFSFFLNLINNIWLHKSMKKIEKNSFLHLIIVQNILIIFKSSKHSKESVWITKHLFIHVSISLYLSEMRV